MAQEGDRLLAARAGSALYVQVHGLGAFSNAHVLESVCTRMIEAGVSSVVVDLQVCRGMDSTFMGVLVGITHCASRQGASVEVTLINADHHNFRIIENLGLDKVCTVRHDPVVPPDGVDMIEIPDAGVADDRQYLALLRRAHENLCELGSANENAFRPVIDQLRKSI